MKKIRIGILCNNLNNLENWEYRLFDRLLDLDYCDIAILIQDGRKKK